MITVVSKSLLQQHVFDEECEGVPKPEALRTIMVEEGREESFNKNPGFYTLCATPTLSETFSSAASKQLKAARE